jgi:hypothetical protein
MTRKPPFDEWRDIIAKMVPSQADLDNVRSILAEPKKAPRRRPPAKKAAPPPTEPEKAAPPPTEPEKAAPPPTEPEKAAPPAEPEKAAASLVEPDKPVRRGGNRRRFELEPLKRLLEEHPTDWTNEQLRGAYQEAAKTLPGTPSLEWVKKQAPKLRRSMGIKE